MQLGFVSATLPDQTFEQVVAFAAANRFSCVELMCWPAGKAERRYAGVTHVDVGQLDDGAVAKIQGTLAKHGVAISGLGYYPNPLSPDQNEADTCIAHLRKILRAAVRLGVRQVNTFVGRDWRASLSDNWARFRTVWQPLVAEASDLGLRIGIENCPMLFSGDEWPGGKNLAVSPAIWRRMFNEIPDPCFGLNYDPSHLVWQGMDHCKPLKEFAARIHHVHAKDVRVDQDRLDDVGILALPLEYHAPVLPGRGKIDWRAFFAALEGISYRGPVCIEVEDREYESTLERRQEALRWCGGFLSGLMTAGFPT